jgi:hypothetical protein
VEIGTDLLERRCAREGGVLHPGAERRSQRYPCSAVLAIASRRDMPERHVTDLVHHGPGEDGGAVPEPWEADSSAAARMGGMLAQRAATNEALGVLQIQRRCSIAQARLRLRSSEGLDGQAAEVARVAADVDAAAQGRSDPDWV